MAIYVINPGAFTTVQDLGRFGYQSDGIPQSGAMDQKAFLEGNHLLGNPRNAAALEMTLYGGIYRFERDTRIALTGADMSAMADGSPVPMYTPVDIRQGDVLMLQNAADGCRGYLCVEGGIRVPPVLGSRSTTVRCGLGGLEGRALRAGDVLPLSGPGERAADARSLPETDAEEEDGGPAAISQDSLRDRDYLKQAASGEVTVRAIPGPQDDYFTEQGLETFFHAVYTVSTDSDRMGCRLQGEPVESRAGTDILSDGTAFGSVQVPSSGLPIVLMADRQTTGGYAKIATVITADLPVLAQIRPGSRVRFRREQIDRR